MEKLLVYGGTFNPIHNGHLHLAQAFLSITGAKHLLLVPTRVPPHKRAKSLASGAMRLEMCRLAIAGREGWQASPMELERPGDRKSTRLNSSHTSKSRMPSSA